MILGLDASTTCCGWAFAKDGSQIVDMGFLDISDCVTPKEKAFFIINSLKKNKYFQEIESINMEAALSGFMGGRTTQQVIIKLARFSAVLEYILTEEMKLKVNLCNVNTMRKQLFGKSRVKGIKPKEYVKQNITRFVDPTPYDVKKVRGGWDERNGDAYDAVVCALYKPQL